MLLALRDTRLPGISYAEKIENARAAGLDGIEFEAHDEFYQQLPAIADALNASGLRASTLYLGHTTLIHPDYAEREHARVRVRQALGAAVDLGADGVSFYGHYARTHVLPDLHPYKSALELEAELLSAELRATLCDLAYAMGKRLFLLHAHSGETALLRRLQHAVKMRLVQNEHPYLWAAASIHHMAMEGEHLAETLRAHLPHVGCVYIGDHGRRWPGAEGRDLSPIAELLRTANYAGWVIIEGNDPQTIPADFLAPMVKLVRAFGF